MVERDYPRKLTAIFSADVAGYSRLMSRDEMATVQNLEACREVISASIEKHRGRVIDSPGDNILAEFASVVDAVQCAVTSQKKLGRRNTDVSRNAHMQFRIGINLGDVIVKDGRIYGDGVNVAARLESLADPGGICIAASVYDQVKNKLDLEYEYMGKRRVKNIAEPVEVYRVFPDTETVQHVGAPGSIQAEAAPRNPCIAVLSFENLSERREDDYFSRGFVEDLNTDLAHFHNLQVIASDSAQKIGTDSRQAVETAGELEIDYLLKGNIRRKSEKIRINAQLLESSHSRILWAERFDAPLETIFDIQDEIVEQVVGAISARIDKTLLAAARKKPITSLAAYDCWLRGMDQMRVGTPAADRKARRIFKQALDIDPDFARAYAGLSLSHFNEWSCQIWDQWEETGRRAYDYALKAAELDDTDHIVQMILGRILLYRRQFDAAEQHLDRSLSLNSNDADCLAQTATSKSYLGHPSVGERLFRKALRLNPYHDTSYYTYGAFPYFVQRRYEPFIQTALKGPLTEVWLDQPAFLAVAYAHRGRRKKAAHYRDVFIETFTRKITAGRRPLPGEIIEWMKKANPFKRDDDVQHLVQGFLAAGLEDLTQL